jgi:4-amino-4-deoxy-L-arabinose transferase-like glycosyltransferase
MKLSDYIESNPRLALLFFVGAGLIIRLALLPYRWINPDEGAHLMDARLLLQGLIPLVDFGSKQPLYVVLLAGLLRLFGQTLLGGRLLPVLAQAGITVLLYAVGRRVFNIRAGLLAAGIFSFLPLAVIWAPVVKTESPAMLLALLSIYCLIKGMGKKESISIHLFLAGAVAAMAYYVRQSTLYVPLSAFLFMMIYARPVRSFRMAAWTAYVLGFVSICLFAGLLYSSRMSASQLFYSPINPLELFISRALNFLGLVPAQYRIVDSDQFRIMDQDVSYTWTAWKDSLLFTLAIVLAAAWALWSKRSQGKTLLRESLAGLIVLWLTVVLSMYLFQSLHRGFFTQYYLEVLLPFLLLAAWTLARLCAEKGWFNTFLVTLFFFVIAMAAGRFLGDTRPFFIILMAAAIALPVTGLLYRKNRSLVVMAGYGCLLWGGLVMALYSGNKIGPRYECIWAPQTLTKVCATIEKEGKDATVLSGTTIWAFASGLSPYQNIAHPTELMRKFRENWGDSFTQTPPDFIILDGYTQRKYSRYWKLIQDELKSRYEQVAAVGDSRYPVQIYRLTIQPRAAESTYTGVVCP